MVVRQCVLSLLSGAGPLLRDWTADYYLTLRSVKPSNRYRAYEHPGADEVYRAANATGSSTATTTNAKSATPVAPSPPPKSTTSFPYRCQASPALTVCSQSLTAN